MGCSKDEPPQRIVPLARSERVIERLGMKIWLERRHEAISLCANSAL
jgi:hypothetical protein